jgi:hypothetical protein
MQVCFRPSLTLDQPRQRKHDRNAGNENKEGKDEVVEPKTFPLCVGHLCAKKLAHGIEHRAFATQDSLKRYHRAIGADDPENAEATHRIDGKDTACL